MPQINKNYIAHFVSSLTLSLPQPSLKQRNKEIAPYSSSLYLRLKRWVWGQRAGNVNPGNNSQLVPGTYCIPGTVLSALRVL